MTFRIFCDFDGTISCQDSSNAIFERFAAGWLDIERLWEDGAIGSAECMRQQVGRIDANSAELDLILDEIEIDPAFPEFARWCEAAGLELTVVSDGVDYFIHRILERKGLSQLTVRANRLIRMSERSYSLGHPHQAENCGSLAGACKCGILAGSGAGGRTVFIGDGRSDYCVSHKADILFAKGNLLDYTRRHAIKAFEFSNFACVNAILESLICRRKPKA